MDFMNELSPMRINVNQSVSLNLFEDTADDSNYIIKETTLASTTIVQTDQSEIPWSRSMETPNASMIQNGNKCEETSRLEVTKLSPTIFKPNRLISVSTSTPTLNKVQKPQILPLQETPIINYNYKAPNHEIYDLSREAKGNKEKISCELDNKFKDCINNDNPPFDEYFRKDFYPNDQKTKATNIFESFKTAAGAQIVISQTTLEKVKQGNVFNEDVHPDKPNQIRPNTSNASSRIIFEKASGGTITSTFINPQIKLIPATKRSYKSSNPSSRTKFVPPFKMNPVTTNPIILKTESKPILKTPSLIYGEIYKYVSTHKNEFKLPRLLETEPENQLDFLLSNDQRFLFIKKILNESDFENFIFTFNKEEVKIDKHKRYFINLNKDGLVLFINNHFGASKIEFAQTFYLMIGVDENLVDSDWVFNQYRFIIYKLALLEYKFPSRFLNKYLIPYWVLTFLKYRYDIEINKSKRSILKMITEKDTPPNYRMILRISRVSVPNFINHPLNVIELTDGWYPIVTEIDNEIFKLIKNNHLKLHEKLVICNASIKTGHNNAGNPIEMYGKIIISISINSIRKAHEKTILGFAYPSTPFIVPLKSLKPIGIVGGVHVIVSRFYGSEYCERLSDGHCIYRNEYEEDIEIMNHQKLIINESSDIYNDLLSTSLNINPSKSVYNSQNIDNDFHQQLLDDTRKIIEQRYPKRNTSRVYKYKVTCLETTNPLQHSLLFMWNVNEETLDLLREGNCLYIYNLKCSSNRDFSSSISFKLSSSSYTKITKSNTKSDLSLIYQPRELVSLRKLHEYIENGITEVDVIGTYFSFPNSSEYYLVDRDENIVRIIDARKYNKNTFKVNNGDTITLYNLLYKNYDKGESIATLYYSTLSNYYIGLKNTDSSNYEPFSISDEFIDRIKVKVGFS